ncbi:MAG: cation diffusion facilitator family transporter [Bacillota bacterium]
MSHSHVHSHSHTHTEVEIKGSRLIFVVALNFVITIAQTVGGLYSGSLSLISDALHNFSDGVAIMISYFAIRISKRGRDHKRTYGYKRSSILAAALNSIALIVISILLFKEAITKLIFPQAVNGGIVIWVALLGLLANAAGMLLLRKFSKGDMNIKSSYIHLLSDALSSAAVVVGGILIYFFNLYWVDPVLTLLIGFLVLRESYEIVKRAANILMQGTPEHIDTKMILNELKKIEQVKKIDHVHVWGLDEKNVNFEAHVYVTDVKVSETKPIIAEIEKVLHENGINHVTIQVQVHDQG